ncbi:MAG: hypothetical protein SFW35_06455 [Chitinophagales bacterium]|nr:hypothetical protein [Chitinophagales bacterium]
MLIVFFKILTVAHPQAYLLDLEEEPPLLLPPLLFPEDEEEPDFFDDEDEELDLLPPWPLLSAITVVFRIWLKMFSLHSTSVLAPVLLPTFSYC